MRDRRTDGGNCNIPDAFLKKCGDNNSLKYNEPAHENMVHVIGRSGRGGYSGTPPHLENNKLLSMLP